MCEPLCSRCNRDIYACRCHWLTPQERAAIDLAAQRRREAEAEESAQRLICWARARGLENVLPAIRERCQ